MFTVLSQRLLKYSVLTLIKRRNKLLGDRLPAPTIPYFAYGANLDPERFLKYDMNAIPVSVAQLADYQLTFSLPCEYVGQGYGSIEPAPGKEVWGYLYRIDAFAFALLDIMEYAIFHHYRRAPVTVKTSEGKDVKAFAYIAQYPVAGLAASTRYKSRIIAAANLHDFPASYRAEIERLPSRDTFDLDPGFRLSAPGRRRLLEQRLKRWYLKHDQIREIIANKIKF
jgi:gamma-glutamylcyclotransferase (GGCT)/AIG2-like uncharacterized protein YtfP